MSTLHHNAADKGVPMTLGELRQFVDRALGFEDDAELFDLDGNPVDRLTLADKTEAPFDPNAGTEQPWYQRLGGLRPEASFDPRTGKWAAFDTGTEGVWGFTPGLPGTSVHESVEAGLRRQHALTHVDGTTCPTCAVFAAPRDTPVTPQEPNSDTRGTSNDVLDGMALDAVRASIDAENGTAPYALVLRAFPGLAGALNKALDRLVKAGTLTFGTDGYRVVG